MKSIKEWREEVLKKAQELGVKQIENLIFAENPQDILGVLEIPDSVNLPQ